MNSYIGRAELIVWEDRRFLFLLHVQATHVIQLLYDNMLRLMAWRQYYDTTENRIAGNSFC